MPTALTTGLPGLDYVLKGVMPGDNIVWKVESIADYKALVEPYVEAARRANRRLIYFRFASHEQLIPDHGGAEIYRLEPAGGFEQFVTRVHEVINAAGRGTIYVFDCISDLASQWQADQMLGNFFVLTCPRLFDLDTVTYFALYRNYHACYALNPITETTQFLLDVFRHKNSLYIRPIKVQHRSSSSMNTIHRWGAGNEFIPITSSAIIADILTSARWPGLMKDSRRGFWRRLFEEAETAVAEAQAGRDSPGHIQDLFNRLVRMVLSKDEAIIALITQYMTITDVLSVRDRMIGIGQIGGKAIGMLLARAILRKSNPDLNNLLETHDSFFVGSDVFYTLLVRNGIWGIRQKQRHPDTFLEGIEEARARILKGEFPDYTMQQFIEIIDYFGESPYIVRSSSLLEDNYGNAFAGKYESVFCVNQGTREQRLHALLDAIRHIYASAMSETALNYRLRRGVLDHDEQMALLIMRVSGESYGSVFLPHMAGVGFSYNPYVWHKRIDPKAGVLRLVFGLGTRAVDRSDDDYTRVVSLSAPEVRPEANFDEVCEYSQKRVDYLDLPANRQVSGSFQELLSELKGLPVEMFASPDLGTESSAHTQWILTFDRLLTRTTFVQVLRSMLQTLEQAYNHPVDIEFTANFIDRDNYRINLLQCRPLHVQGVERAEMPEINVPPEARLLEAHGAVIGHSRIQQIDRLIYIVPSAYANLTLSRRHELARIIGHINARQNPRHSLMLLGPGRWGTSSPELGIPVTYAEVNRVSVLCEIVTMRENLIPDVSLGTHFLNEIVEQNILYLALFPKQTGSFLNEAAFLEAPNLLLEIMPHAAEWAHVVRIIDPARSTPDRGPLLLAANAIEQSVLVFRSATAFNTPLIDHNTQS